MATFAGNAEGVMGDTPHMDSLHPSRFPGGTAIQQRCPVQSTRPKGDAMQQHMVVAVMASVMWALVGGTALGQVAGSTTIGVTVDEQKVLAVGWSAKKTILDKAVYSSSGEKIGEVEDLIITPEKAVSYAIVGTGGFLGIAQHDVAIPVGQLKLEGDKLMLPGATKEGLKALPKFEYAK
jgi:sporulation protein YlmC with PRC-barrel domain